METLASFLSLLPCSSPLELESWDQLLDGTSLVDLTQNALQQSLLNRALSLMDTFEHNVSVFVIWTLILLLVPFEESAEHGSVAKWKIFPSSAASFNS